MTARQVRSSCMILTSNSDLDPDINEDEQCKKMQGTQAENLLILPTTVSRRIVVLRLPQFS